MNVEATMHTLDMNQIQTIMRAGGGAGASSSNSRRAVGTVYLHLRCLAIAHTADQTMAQNKTK